MCSFVSEYKYSTTKALFNRLRFADLIAAILGSACLLVTEALAQIDYV